MATSPIFGPMRLSFLPLACAAALCHAQGVNAPQLQLRTGPLDLVPCPACSDVLRPAPEEGAAPRVHRYLAFDHTLTSAERTRIVLAGIRLLDPLRPHGWTASVPAAAELSVLHEVGLTGVQRPLPAHKLSPALAKDIAYAKPDAWTAVTVVPWPDLGDQALGGALLTVTRLLDDQGAVEARIRIGDLQALLTDPRVQWVAPAAPAGEPEDLRGVTFHRVNPIGGMPGTPGLLSGDGVTVVVNDDGLVGPHIDFTGRTLQTDVAQDPVGDHGDMVAGIVGGAGNLDPTTVGMAPGARIIVEQYQGNLPSTIDLYQDEGAVIFNSSYSDGCNAGYTTITRKVDQEIHDNPAIVQVFSAGNEGNSDCGYGAGAGWGNITGGHKIAKNCIAVANLTDNEMVVSSSSRGPTEDGRLKPDISAYGQGQTSTDPGNSYSAGGGTSAAAPGVAGSLAVLYEGWRDIHGSDPASGLIKALVLNTADDLGATGPDHVYGWGRLNAARAWQAMSEAHFIPDAVDQGQQLQHVIDVPPGVTEVRFMLYWTDPEAALQSPVVLVNDLDLQAFDPSNALHRPWEIANTPDPAVLATPASPGEDHLNNAEQVRVLQPTPGPWTITVEGTDIPLGPQAYWIVYDFRYAPPAITYPLAGDVLTTNGSHRMRWEATRGTTSFNIALSVDSGATWSSLPPLAADRLYYDLITGSNPVFHAFVRVERDGFTDQSGPFAILPFPQGLNVTFNCADSMGLAWTPVPLATGYILHKLGTQYMDSVGFTTTTDHVFHGLQPVHSDWFAVTAVFADGQRSRRSLALARPQQLVACQAQRDLMITAVLSPASLVLQCQPDPEVVVRVRNVGIDPVQDMVLGHRLNGGNAIVVPLSQPLAPGDSFTYTFPSTLGGLQQGMENSLEVWATAQNESFPPNDTLVRSVLSSGQQWNLPFSENGEGLTPCSTSAQCDLACDDLGLLFNGRNGIDDDIDWRVDTAGTPTSNTGPAVDHTLGNDIGRYFYLESSGNCSQRQADLFGPCVALPSQPAQMLVFWYHMEGAGQGELHVDLIANGNTLSDVAPVVSGDQGDQWIQGTVDLGAYAGMVITPRFRGITGPSSLSDLALDDIGITTATGITEASKVPSFIVHPTDAEGGFLVVLNDLDARDARMEVVDITGRYVLAQRQLEATGRRIDLRAMAAGVYVVRLTVGERLLQRAIVRP